MVHRIELVAALLATALGLIWLVYEVTTLQTSWFLGALAGSGAGPAPGAPIGANPTGLYFAGTAATFICVALGAYLHVVQRLLLGLLLVWLAAATASVAIGFYVVEPWRFVPVQFIYIVQATTYIWLTPASVLSVVLAWVAALCGLPIPSEKGPRAGALPSPRRRSGPESMAAP